jgi:hypothetical protein
LWNAEARRRLQGPLEDGHDAPTHHHTRDARHGNVAAWSSRTPAGTDGVAASGFAAIYSKGTAWTDDQKAFQHPSIQQHMQHFRSLGDRLLGAAPFSLDPSDRAVRMVLLLADSLEAARA